ncbi:hypothetical protein, partial [Pseudomonas aeruginosa]|uniref:hypothetical protein n=1 Tax=Pseudomonas aeruginosa TaxID=287 RepID=UPI001C0B7DD8
AVGIIHLKSVSTQPGTDHIGYRLKSACMPGSKKTLKFGPIYQSAEAEKLIFMPKMKEARHPWSLRSSA